MKTVLFVCVHNTGRSQMAEAFFNAIARGDARAFSAGTMPDQRVHPSVVEAMKEIGVDISRNRPKALTVEMAEQADRIFTMGCGADAAGICPGGLLKTEDWALDDPKDQPVEKVRQIRDDVKARVEKLIEELASDNE